MTAYELAKQIGFEKRAGLLQALTHGPGSHALEVAGLATLAAPTVHEMVTKPMYQTPDVRRFRHAAELSGLGMLATPSIIKLLKNVR